MGNSFVKGVQCSMSDPANPHTFSQGVGINPPSGCFSCDKQDDNPDIDFHYRCATCDVAFHRGCHEYPRKIRHPYHLQHPLTVIELFNETDGIFHKCHWCREAQDNLVFRCFICGFCLCHRCTEKYPPLTIQNPKSHHHPLVFFPRPFSLPCDACGVVDIKEPGYTCFQCNYMVHQSCIDLPRVIKITRHPHRLSFTPYFLPEISTCQICFRMVDMKYGQYSCNHDGCSYVAHSKCATHKHVWDGSELEWEPEETNEKEDIESFKKVGEDLIKYFCHDHYLKLQTYDRARDSDKQCQACIFPIDSGDFYNCIQCHFFLHEVCANLPRKIEHALHLHALVLEPSPQNVGTMNCSACSRIFSGFRYKCSKYDCQDRDYKVDIRCILVPDFLTRKSHEHPLFISTFLTRYIDENLCKGCTSVNLILLRCTLCEFALCYTCATIPTEVYYKHDEHHLSLCRGEEVNDTYWCEICEKAIDPTKWFYTCTKCCTTIHLHCILGESVYMKPGYTFTYYAKEMEVVRNNSNTRPICRGCGERCPHLVYYKGEKRSVCSPDCFAFC